MRGQWPESHVKRVGPMWETRRVSDIWRLAARRSKEFDDSAVAYDRYRPRYPDAVIDDIVELGHLQPGARTVEIGAGTGIGTEALVERGLQVVAIEPSEGMRELAEVKLGDRAQFVGGRFEDFSALDSAEAIVAFSAWHWVEPSVGLDLAARLLSAGGVLAVAWTEVVSWGQGDFEDRLAEVTGSPWPKTVEHMRASLEPLREDPRFDEIAVRTHRFERELDAQTFVGLTRTYPGFHTAKRDARFEQIIVNDFADSIQRVEDGVLNLFRRT
jgi:SAM-dependent methyltransferase